MPFPFTDLTTSKKRPALIVSPDRYNELGLDVVIAFLTSQINISRRPGDYRIQFWKKSGLPKSSLLRMKFATIDRKIIDKKLGRIIEEERDPVQAVQKSFFLE